MRNPGRPTRRQFVAGSTGLAAALMLPLAHAQSGAKFPSKQIRIIVPFPPGGLTDAYARLYGEQLTQQLGASVQVENKIRWRRGDRHRHGGQVRHPMATRCWSRPPAR